MRVLHHLPRDAAQSEARAEAVDHGCRAAAGPYLPWLKAVPKARPPITEATLMSENIEAGWTLETVQQLKAMAREGVPASVRSLKLKRPVTAIHAKLAELGITPTAET